MSQLYASGAPPSAPSSAQTSPLPVATPMLSVVKEGMLRKQGGRVQSWKDRWFVLTTNDIAYFKTRNSEEPIKRIQVSAIKSCDEVQAQPDSRGARPDHFYFTLNTEGRLFTICSRTAQERSDWVAAIRQYLPAPAVVASPIEISAEQAEAERAEAETREKAAAELEAANAAAAAAAVIVPKPFTPATRAPTSDVPLERTFEIEQFVGQMKSIVRSEKFSDITFEVGESNFYAHKAIIAARCPKLAGLFQAHTARVPLVGIEPAHFSIVLDFIYADEAALTPANAVDLYHAAATYGLSRLQQLTETYVRDNISVDNVLTLLKAANRREARELERLCLGFVSDVQRYQSVIRQKEATEIAQVNKDLYVRLSQVLAEAPEAFAHSLGDVIVGPTTLTSDLLGLLSSVAHADVHIKAKDSEIFAHRILLVTRCESLLHEGGAGNANLAQSGFVTLRLPTLEGQVIYTLLQYLYSNSVSVDRLHDTYGLIALADSVQQDPIVSVCNEMMRQNLNASTALKILMVSSKYQLLTLKKATLALIVRESGAICTRKDLKPVLNEFPNNLIDICRALVKGEGGAFSDDEDDDDDEDEDTSDFERI
ncbi:hypothetical protein CAOG_00261 [Capsaspora owczarzaki ATCC 30864]|uniref:PH domain-containing protein n=1 Tax=Capsaspora owczarzaki (strain ATCC 30864) TaxID=595528 RepID=A0A0D2VFX2_CAPO3|nr:hypothetical protein CAOG_00261 [Capsaspora owczarzaki ATCC 30864]KJE88652.1 hypothetical protein CAOG_000261 [Capsaspora owczarzaki ATCC 30864]|eukprot:XP_004365132.2 hypothetical protein CAOG_00261 [Capsaspora owczarzaki ATCC 30864]